MSLRDVLNTASPNNIADALRDIGFGDLINTIISGLASTETGVSVSSNVGALANQPSYRPFIINATGGTTQGVKQVLGPAPITGPNALIPVSGQCVWDGGKNILFAVVDAVSAFKTTYAKASDATASVLSNNLGNRVGS